MYKMFGFMQVSQLHIKYYTISRKYKTIVNILNNAKCKILFLIQKLNVNLRDIYRLLDMQPRQLKIYFHSAVGGFQFTDLGLNTSAVYCNEQLLKKSNFNQNNEILMTLSAMAYQCSYFLPSGVQKLLDTVLRPHIADDKMISIHFYSFLVFDSLMLSAGHK